MRPLLSLFLFGAPLAHAQDGAQLYTLYCSACHGTDGKGANGGAFPPLAGSPWLEGDPDRAVKIVLHGLEGPVEILGKTYNLAMPPQGTALPDDTIAAILTHVRSAWGNKDAAVTPVMVEKFRRQTADRPKPWTAPEILKLHPLPVEPSALSGLVAKVYRGEWRDLPDFAPLTPAETRPVPNGLVGLDLAGKETERFAIVWEGRFEAPADGEYQFLLDADDGARLILADKQLAEIRKLGPINGGREQRTKVTLAKGSHPFRLEYYEFQQNQGLQLSWKGPGMKSYRWLSSERPKPEKIIPPILLEPVGGRAVVYRNFITGTTPRAIGVGFPGGLNLAWSADHLGAELLWTGKFIDAGRHWTDRGQGNQPPAGDHVIKLNTGRALPENAVFKGFQLDPKGNPTFKVKIGEQILTDSWQPGGSESQPALVRQISLSGGGPSVEIVISDLFAALPIDDREFSLGDQLYFRGEPVQPQARGGRTLLTLQPGESTTLTFRWKSK